MILLTFKDPQNSSGWKRGQRGLGCFSLLILMTYVSMYVCMYVHIHTYIHTYVCVCVCIYTYIYAYVCMN
jgi:hypothetical protein